MRSFGLFLFVLFQALVAGAAPTIDMNDPRRAIGREDDIRVDAQILQETVSPGSVIGVAYRIENLTSEPVAVAEKVCNSSYDADSGTVTLAIGSEVPESGLVPRLATILPGESRTFTTGAPLHIVTGGASRGSNAPRLVQVKVSVLRHLAPFVSLMKSVRARLTDQQFDAWLESNDTIVLNAVPVRFNPERSSIGADAGAHRPRY